jgi:hypothetical protein
MSTARFLASCLLYRIIIAVFLFLSLSTTACHALSLNKNKNNINASANQQQHALLSRRQAMAFVLGTAMSTMTTLFRNYDNDLVAHASCIAGDTSVDCIGSYKEPIPKMKRDRQAMQHQNVGNGALVFQDMEIQQYTLRPHRDNVIIITPDTLADAIGILSDQRLALDDMEQLVVKAGDLEQAGVLLLAALPKLTVAGRFAVYAVPTNWTRMIQPLLTSVEESAATLDRTIALSLRGKNGSLTVAQLAVLKDISQTKLALDNLIQLATLGAAQTSMQ